MGTGKMDEYRRRLFAAYPQAAALDKALSSDGNRTPLFYMAKSQIPDLNHCWWALGRLGPELERQFSLAGEVVFLFTLYSDLQSRTHEAVCEQLRDEIAEHLVRAEGSARFNPDPRLALIWSPDPDMASKLETWNTMKGSTVAAISGDYPAERSQALELVRASIARVVAARDLYKGKDPVTGNDFFGRQELLTRIQGELAAGRSVGLFGLRRSGKTSVIKEYKRREEKYGVVVVEYDLEDVGSTAQVPKALGDALTKSLGELQEAGSKVWVGSERDRDSATFAELASRIIKTAEKNRSHRFVIAVDEIEYLTGFVKTNPSEVRQFFGALRRAAQTASNVALLLTGVTTKYFDRSILDVETQEGNPLFSFVDAEFLPPFTVEETSNLVKKLGRAMLLDWDDDALVAVHDTAGGMPLLVRQLASRARSEAISRDRRNSDGNVIVDVSSVAAAGEDWREEGYREWFDVLATLEMHHPVLAMLVGAPAAELPDLIDAGGSEGAGAARDLERLGMLKRVEGKWRPSESLAALQSLGVTPEYSVADVLEEVRSKSDPAVRVRNLIAGDESRDVEFKDRVKLNAYSKSEDAEKNTLPVMKSIAAFANCVGGTLLIGVTDKEGVYGIEEELRAMGERDGYERFIRDKMDRFLSGTHGDDGVDINFVDIDGSTVCVVDVEPSPVPVYFVKSEVDQTLYVRRGGSTKPRAGMDALQYIQRRFPQALSSSEEE